MDHTGNSGKGSCTSLCGITASSIYLIQMIILLKLKIILNPRILRTVGHDCNKHYKMWVCGRKD